MIYAYTYKYARQAVRDAFEFAKNHPGEIKRVEKRDYTIVYMRNGDEHHFMSYVWFGEWRIGRTYMIGNSLWHSDYCVKRGDSE